MPSTKNTQKAAAARARAAKSRKKTVQVVQVGSAEISESSSSDFKLAAELDDCHDPDIECTGWTGGVNYVPSDSDSDDEDWKDTDWDGPDGGGAESNDNDNEDLEDLEGGDLLDGLRNKWELLQQELEDLAKPTPYEHILKKTRAKEWKKAETKRGLGYNGLSARRKREIAQQLREKEEQDKVTRER
jgi:hypothetical protein